MSQPDIYKPGDIVIDWDLAAKATLVENKIIIERHPPRLLQL
jgi:hypothetical protein